MLRDKAIQLVQDVILEHEYRLPQSYDLKDTFVSLGADSLDIVEMIMLMEDRLEISLPPIDLKSIVTIEDAIKHIEKYE